ncbi:TatD family hydrolase [Candidatus Parcubacteria bacterium]|nr:TatD family hydrolase [Candidatus Parcubacteria bacterium]
MLIDTHTHINFKEFRNDGDQIIRNCLNKKIWMVIPGSDYKSSRMALEYANKYEKGVYAAVGLHPIHLYELKNEKGVILSRDEEFNYDIYEKLAKFEKAVAIGEIGLDYYHLPKDVDTTTAKNKQKDVLWQQLLLARRLDLPAIIHCRQAHDDMIELIKEFKKKYRNLMPISKPWAVMHCFSGTESLAWQYFELGLIVSFTGLITFSQQWDELIRKLPYDKFMIETDSPYMTPEPHRGERNVPEFVGLVANRIAEIKKLSFERIAEITTDNAKKLFKIS